MLVEDASRLLFAARVVANALEPGKLHECRVRHGWEIVQQVQRHAQRVTSEQAIKEAISARRSN